MLSLHTGYDTSYLTDAVGTGAAAADYYTGAKGEPPGYWQGTGAAALGLAGLVDADVMRALYHEDVGPDGQVLVRRQRQVAYPAAGGSLYDRIEAEVAAQVAELGRFCTPEEERRIRLKERAKFRTRVPFYDFTFSAPKTVTVLWASLLAAAAEAAEAGDEAEAERLAERAEQVRGAVRRANDRMIAVMERESAYVRTGHHSAATGEWRDAQGFIVASFQQHDARDGAPQLHVHNAIANRAQRADGADAKWRSLDGTPLYRERLRYGTLADRFLAQELELLGIRTALREDGKALEVCGISEDAVDTYSTRAAEVRDRARELAADYEREHGHAPGKAAWYKIRQRAALETRDSKDHNPPAAGQQLRAWAGQAERSGIGKLSSLHEAVAEHAAEHEPSEVPGEAERASIIRQAVAAVQAVNASWHRAQLIFELGQALGALPGEVDPEAYLNGLADEALSGRAEGVNVVQIAPVPDVIDVTRLGLRKDGTSIYRKPGEARFVTAEHLDHEQHLVDIARLPLPQRITAEAAAAALEGTDLDHFQREACLGLLTARRLISCLVAPAGTGKTHVMAAFARIWAELAGGRVIGLTASTNAARVMAAEAAAAGAPMTTANIAQFLGKIKDSDRTRGHMPVYPGDVLIVDEASQVGTEDMLRIERVARQCGAMVVMVGDTEQLEAVDAGGIFRLIAARHGSWQLTEVRRFRSAWERDASLRLRRGEVAALAEYAARGRIYHGPQDRAYDDAVMLYLNGHLTGKESLLLATSNETAARLAALVRERLAERGLVGPAELTLADGNRAGQGDLIRARLNTRIDADGQTLANRDTIRIEGLAGTGPEQLAVVTRQTAPGSWSKPFFVQVRYLQHSAELAYAGNVHVAQGRTVDRAHLVVEGGANRSLLYTGMTRGREKNTAHVVTGAPDPAQPARAEREAFTDAALRQRAGLRQAGDAEAAKAVPLVMPARPSDRQMAPWEAIMAQALQQDEPERTALEEMAAAADFATHTGHLLQLSEAYWRLDVVPQIDEMIRQRLSPADYDRYRHDPERDALLQALREHEIGGREIPDVLDAITAEPMTGLRSIAAGLHGRLGKEPAPARGETTGWAERAPRSAPEPVAAAARMLDARQAELGRQLAERPPQWALQAWGAPPAEGAVRAEWERRAGLVGTYREAAGITDPAQAIGPVPSGQAQLREAFHASVVALELPDDQALLRAMGQGQLEAAVAAHDRAAALAPPDVQAQIGERRPGPDRSRHRGGSRGYRRCRDGGARPGPAGCRRRRPPRVVRSARRGGRGRPGRRGRAPPPRPGRPDPRHGRRGGRGRQPGAGDSPDRPGAVGPAQGPADSRDRGGPPGAARGGGSCGSGTGHAPRRSAGVGPVEGRARRRGRSGAGSSPDGPPGGGRRAAGTGRPGLVGRREGGAVRADRRRAGGRRSGPQRGGGGRSRARRPGAVGADEGRAGGRPGSPPGGQGRNGGGGTVAGRRGLVGTGQGRAGRRAAGGPGGTPRGLGPGLPGHRCGDRQVRRFRGPPGPPGHRREHPGTVGPDGRRRRPAGTGPRGVPPRARTLGDPGAGPRRGAGGRRGLVATRRARRRTPGRGRFRG
jgi:conjugative relaxase-like TrwC/TraI family protein